MTDQQISVAPTTRNESGPGLIDWPARWVACDYPERRAVYAQTVSHDGCAACLIAARAAARDQPEEFGWYVGYLERAPQNDEAPAPKGGQ